jgi:ribose-phosphate pyrophosphokinase
MTFADPKIFAGRPVLLVDDIVSSGGTVLACTKALLAAGATSVDAIITHALFPPEMVGAFKAAGLASVRSTHSVPHPTNAIELDALFADALRREFTETAERGTAS